MAPKAQAADPTLGFEFLTLANANQAAGIHTMTVNADKSVKVELTGDLNGGSAFADDTDGKVLPGPTTVEGVYIPVNQEVSLKDNPFWYVRGVPQGGAKYAITLFYDVYSGSPLNKYSQVGTISGKKEAYMDTNGLTSFDLTVAHSGILDKCDSATGNMKIRGILIRLNGNAGASVTFDHIAWGPAGVNLDPVAPPTPPVMNPVPHKYNFPIVSPYLRNANEGESSASIALTAVTDYAYITKAIAEVAANSGKYNPLDIKDSSLWAYAGHQADNFYMGSLDGGLAIYSADGTEKYGSIKLQVTENGIYDVSTTMRHSLGYGGISNIY
ncbi:MAG: hypothetical protein RSA70_03815, partial [Clostridia bacterium]